MPLVVDASLTLAWCFPDESTEATERARERAGGDTIVVPAHWAIEVANGLAVGRRRGRIENSEISAFCGALDRLDVRIEESPDAIRLPELIERAARLDLTSYDVAYVLLASAIGSALGTLDRRIIATAGSLGIETFGHE